MLGTPYSVLAGARTGVIQLSIFSLSRRLILPRSQVGVLMDVVRMLLSFGGVLGAVGSHM